MITWPVAIVIAWVFFMIGFFTAALMSANRTPDDSKDQGR